jgi:type III restriction enzyme
MVLLSFGICYSLDGEEKSYLPDYLIQIDNGRGADDYLNLILNVSGEARNL